MVRFLTAAMLAGLFAVSGSAAIAADAPKDTVAKPAEVSIELTKFTFKAGEGIAAELFGYNDGEEKLFFYAGGTATAPVKAAAGKYDVVITASCNSAEKENAKFKLLLDGKQIDKEVTLKTEDQGDYTITLDLAGTDQKLSIEYTNDVYKEGDYDRNLYIHAVKLKPKK